MPANVSGGMSVLLLPATVIISGFAAWRNCLWLPRIHTCRHTSARKHEPADDEWLGVPVGKCMVLNVVWINIQSAPFCRINCATGNSNLTNPMPVYILKQMPCLTVRNSTNDALNVALSAGVFKKGDSCLDVLSAAACR